MSGTLGKGHRQTPEILAKVVDAIKLGLPLDRAFHSAGISKATGHAWRRSGWEEIEQTDEDSDEEMGFKAVFAIQVESALSTYMQPLVQRVSDAALGRGKGDWRAAHAILASRFPHEFSERVAVAKSQRMEISGGIDHSIYSVRLESMTIDELRAESERHDAVIYAGLGGPSLDREIEKLERQLAGLCKSRDHEHEIGTRPRGKYSTGPAGSLTRRPPLELTDYEVTGATEFEHESNDVLAAVSKAPDAAEGSGVVARPSATPSVSFHVNEEPPARGIGYRADGLAVNLADLPEEDTTL